MSLTTQKASYKGHEIVTTLHMTEQGDWLPDATIDGATCELLQRSHKDRQDAYGRAFRTARDLIDHDDYR